MKDPSIVPGALAPGGGAPRSGSATPRREGTEGDGTPRPGGGSFIKGEEFGELEEEVKKLTFKTRNFVE